MDVDMAAGASGSKAVSEGRKGWWSASRRLRQVDVVKLLDTSRKMLRQWEAAGMPRNADRTYDLRAVLVWLKARWLEGTDGENGKAPSGSPELERQRRYRADMLELELAERRRVLVRVSDMRMGLSEMCGQIRRAGEILQRQYGREALDILNDAIDEGEALAVRVLGKGED